MLGSSGLIDRRSLPRLASSTRTRSEKSYALLGPWDTGLERGVISYLLQAEQ
jgi:hypothetical protein